MSSKTGIEWTDSTWSPIRARVRLVQVKTRDWPVVDTKVLLEPLKWKPMLTPVGQGGSIQEVRPRPRRIFVENQSDLFREWVTDEMLDRVFAVMALCPQHVFQVLTKRPERMLAYFANSAGFREIESFGNLRS